MSDEMIVRHCAPTLAGIKTGSLFSVDCPDRKALEQQIRDYNRMLVPKGLVMLPLRYHKGRALIYVFRPDSLKADLSREESRLILRKMGYLKSSSPESAGSLRGALKHLAQRMTDGETFPHEIGLFLSYPPEDVRGFIDNGAANFRYAGIWKVYGDVDEARRTFRKYHRCEELYMDSFERGMSLERLAVSKR